MWPLNAMRLRGTARRARRNAVRMVRARLDAVVTTADNARHWANADLLSADAAPNPEVRRILRNRARYEVANNSYARGIVLTLALDAPVRAKLGGRVATGTCSALRRVKGWPTT